MKKILLKRIGKKNNPSYKIDLSITNYSKNYLKKKTYGLYIPKQNIITFAWKSILQNIKLGYIPTKSLIRISLKSLKKRRDDRVGLMYLT